MAFNHAPFIRKCLDGFLMQAPPTGVLEDELWYEILIHDDCSTDGTDDIIREYVEKYPDKIFPLYETENQYRKGKVIDAYNYDRARGRYIAVCEGDDYWTDPNKLQKQVDFMEAHPEYSVCFHRVKHYNIYTGTYTDDKCGSLLKDKEGVDITNELFFKGWYTQPLSELFRVSMFDKSLPYKYKYYRDMHEAYHLLKEGKGRLLPFYGGVRIIHKGGISSMISHEKQFENAYNVAIELYEVNKDQYTRDYLIRTLQWIVDSSQNISKMKKLSHILRIYIMGHNVHNFVKNIWHLIIKYQS
jgi:glycosyltransferase involved in cell wall biosynthesis